MRKEPGKGIWYVDAAQAQRWDSIGPQPNWPRRHKFGESLARLCVQNHLNKLDAAVVMQAPSQNQTAPAIEEGRSCRNL